jgi:hypothetical protein
MNNYVWVLLEGSRPHPLSTDMDSTYLRDGFEANKPRTYIIYTAGLEQDEVASSNAIVTHANLSNACVPRSGRRFWYETKGWSEDQTPRKHDHQQVGLESFGSGGW